MAHLQHHPKPHDGEKAWVTRSRLSCVALCSRLSRFNTRPTMSTVNLRLRRRKRTSFLSPTRCKTVRQQREKCRCRRGCLVIDETDTATKGSYSTPWCWRRSTHTKCTAERPVFKSNVVVQHLRERRRPTLSRMQTSRREGAEVGGPSCASPLVGTSGSA